MSTLRIILYGCYIAFVIIRQYYQWKAKHEIVTDSNSSKRKDFESGLSRAFRNTAMNGLFVILILQVMNPTWIRIIQHSVPILLAIPGVIAAILGLVMLIWTHHHLDRQWSADLEIQQGHRLIVSGPYRQIRHPMYTALYLFFFGTALLSGNFLVEFLSALIIITIHIRIPKEEKMMEEQFGLEYMEYCKKTGNFLPPFKIQK